MYCLFLILSVSNNSKCKKRFSGQFRMVQNDFRDVSRTVVKKVNFNPCTLNSIYGNKLQYYIFEYTFFFLMKRGRFGGKHLGGIGPHDHAENWAVYIILTNWSKNCHVFWVLCLLPYVLISLCLLSVPLPALSTMFSPLSPHSSFHVCLHLSVSIVSFMPSPLCLPLYSFCFSKACLLFSLILPHM